MLLTAACLDEPDCFNLNNYIVGIAFKDIEDSRADTVSFVLAGIEEPPLVFHSDTLLTRLIMPLNYFENETTFFFEDAESHKILRLGYTSQAQFVSENCGEKFVLTNLRVLEHSFDSVRLLIDVPSNDGGGIHIEIYQ